MPPSPTVVTAIVDAARGANRYPDPSGEPLRSRLAEHHGVSASSILVSHGADGVLDVCFRAFCEAGDRVVLLHPTYPFIHNLAVLSGADIVCADSPERLFAAASSADTQMTVLVNPSNPSGQWRTPDDVSSNAPVHGLFVVDEAYADFAPSSVADRAADRPNWVVVRTFSKAFGLAGLRVGYAVANDALIARLAAAQDPYPVSTVAAAAGVAALDDQAFYHANVAMLCDERRRLTDGLRELGWTVGESFANFVFAVPPQGQNLTSYLNALSLKRIQVRLFPDAPEGVRISVGQPHENDALLGCIEKAG